LSGRLELARPVSARVSQELLTVNTIDSVLVVSQMLPKLKVTEGHTSALYLDESFKH